MVIEGNRFGVRTFRIFRGMDKGESEPSLKVVFPKGDFGKFETSMVEETKKYMERKKSPYATLVFILNEEKQVIGKGAAICSKKDIASRKIGSRKALTRAMEDAGFKSYIEDYLRYQRERMGAKG